VVVVMGRGVVAGEAKEEVAVDVVDKEEGEQEQGEQEQGRQEDQTINLQLGEQDQQQNDAAGSDLQVNVRSEWKVNDSVEANYNGEWWVNCRIAKILGDGEYDVVHRHRRKEGRKSRQPSGWRVQHDEIRPAARSDEGERGKQTASTDILAIGDNVKAAFGGEGGEWYPGKISKINANGTYNIAYDDDDTDERLERCYVRLLPRSGRSEQTGHLIAPDGKSRKTFYKACRKDSLQSSLGGGIAPGCKSLDFVARTTTGELYIIGRDDWNPLQPAYAGQQVAALINVGRHVGLHAELWEQECIQVFRKIPPKGKNHDGVCCDHGKCSRTRFLYCGKYRVQKETIEVPTDELPSIYQAHYSKDLMAVPTSAPSAKPKPGNALTAEAKHKLRRMAEQGLSELTVLTFEEYDEASPVCRALVHTLPSQHPSSLAFRRSSTSEF
jgi:hypothetical protein